MLLGLTGEVRNDAWEHRTKGEKKEGREDEVHSLNITESIVWRFFDVDDQVLKKKKSCSSKQDGTDE